MKTKKSKKADLESKRKLFFLIGLLFSLAIVLAAFEWKSPVEKIMIFDDLKIDAPDDEMMPITREKEEKKETLPVQKVFDFKLVTDETDIDDDPDFFESDITPDEAVDVKMYIPQTEEKTDDIPTVWFADEMPEFPGGELALRKFVAQSIKYPVIAQESGIEGKVIVTFIINTNGEVTDVRIFRGVNSSLDNEALRVVRKLPRWKPGKQNGKAVRVNYNVPINFVLQ